MNAETSARPRGRPRDPGVDDSIINSAVDLLVEGGFERLSMEAVAARAGVAKATIYRRYPSKVDLIVAMCQAFTPHNAPDIDTGSLRGDLLELVHLLTRTFSSSTDTGRLMQPMLGAAKENAEVREAMARFSAGRRRRIDDIVKRAVARGELPADADADLIADLLVGSIMYRIVIRNAKADRRFADRLVDAVIAGFGNGDSTPTGSVVRP